MLVAAFRATLEEVIAADVILHVRDVAHEDTEPQALDVQSVLRQLDIDPANAQRLIEVWNKIDAVTPERRVQLANIAERMPDDARPVLVSALTGEGLDTLLAAIEARVSAGRLTMTLALDSADGAGLSWLYRHAEVLARSVREDGRLAVAIRIDPSKAEPIRRRFGAPVPDGAGG
jgi:GTP-binding protein HflX